MQLTNYQFDPALAVDIGTKAAFALGILLVTWLAAKAAKWAFAKLVDRVGFFGRPTGSGESVGLSLGKIVSLFIWLFGLLAILDVLKLGGVAGPITELLDTVMGFVPNLVGAGLLLFIGLMIAGIVRDIAVTAMQAVNLDKWANKGGVEEVTGNNTITKTLGIVIYTLIAIPVAIGALGVLNIATISVPATHMLEMILGAIPNIIAAGILLGIGYLISRFVVSVLTEVLGSLGIDGPITALGLLPAGTKASEIVARVAQIGIILFFAIAATRMLGFAELTQILDQVLGLGGKVLFGAVVIAVGFMIANLIARIIGGTNGSSMAASVVRYSAILLFAFMGLQFMGVGEEIVQTAFSALVIGLAVAGSLAFGLGGREWAAKKLEQLDKE
ncbi:mechanosensitive ion channel [Qipengyuania sp. S6317L1]|uniref:mechanosensitive ion channel n=1 Tax=Qipengyuania sp. S6317L1 TaxID=2926410 RepID=UPI001FF6637D|nr:mechanosensitive ion channel [Qipengyuania sp. S6317L1]MCK0098650.1 mechanosensitive ion channel [Qipengyuania sp. S6317L1]